MSVEQITDYEREQNELELKRIAGKAQHIEINERGLEATKDEFRKKGLVVSREEDYDQETFHLVKKLKEFDRLVVPTEGIRKIIESMVRQPVTIFTKQGKPEVKDALYFNGHYYGTDKRGIDLGAEFHEGSYKRPKLAFTYVDPSNPYDPKTGERRGNYKPSGTVTEHYIFLPENKAERVKFLNDLMKNSPGTTPEGVGIWSTSKL